MVRVAWPGWLLGLLVGVGSARSGAGEPAAATGRAEGELPQSFFPGDDDSVHDLREVCAGGHQPVVSLKIYNVLVQVVAIPVLADGSAERLDSLRLRCGEYRAHWDGKYLDGKARGDSGGLLLPAHRRRRAVHPEDDRPGTELPSATIRGDAKRRPYVRFWIVGMPFRQRFGERHLPRAVPRIRIP